MSSRKMLFLLFVAAFMCSLLLTIPASMLNPGIRGASQGRIELANCNGTLWHGSAVPILHSNKPDTRVISLGTLRWDVSALSLLALQPRITLSWPDEKQALPMEVRVSASKLILSNLYLPLPATLLGELSPYLRPIELGGNITVKSDSLNITANELHGTLIADWTGANSALSKLSPLGDYRFTIRAAGNRGELSLATISGALVLSGSGNISAGGAVNFRGQAQAAEGQQEKLGELLRQLGPESAPGQHAFSLAAP